MSTYRGGIWSLVAVHRQFSVVLLNVRAFVLCTWRRELLIIVRGTAGNTGEYQAKSEGSSSLWEVGQSC